MGLASLAQLRQRKDYLQVDDICYFAQPVITDEVLAQTQGLGTFSGIKEIVPTVFHYLFKENEPEFLLQIIYSIYKTFRESQRCDPDWAERMPQIIQQYLQNRYLTVNDEIDPLALVPYFPYTGFGYHILEGGVTQRIIEAFGLGRLQGIKQLGFLHQPIITEYESKCAAQGFTHTRFQHSLDVPATGELILYNNSRTETDHLRYKTAATSHDVGTPAGGDSTKTIDPKRFNEDTHYPEFLNRVNWDLLPELTTADKSALPGIVLNRGPLGSVLDIADKIAYVSRDAYAFLVPSLDYFSHMQIYKLMVENQEICSLWETVVMSGEKVFFTDKDRLVKFLELRATMFGQLYNNSSSRYWEMFVRTFVLKRLYQTGKVTAEQLCQMQDFQLQIIINQGIGQNYLDSLVGLDGERVEEFNSLAEAEARQRQLNNHERPLTMIEKASLAKPGTHFLVETANGIKPLNKADPESSRHIASLLQPGKPFRLYYIDVPLNDLPPTLRNWDLT